MTPRARLLTAADVAPQDLHTFLARFYPPAKADFLHHHGAWWHGGDHNRWVLAVGERIAGYCAVIPARVRLAGEPRAAIWWVDLVIAPEFRGQGLQSLFDEKIRSLATLKLGFPNALAAAIHRKHGWGVRHDLRVKMLPLRPRHIKAVRQAAGPLALGARLIGWLLSPPAALLRRRLARYVPQTAAPIHHPDPEILARAAQRLPHTLATTHRDADFLHWRYLQSPYRDQLRFYRRGDAAAPSHILIARQSAVQGTPITRILDLYGDLNDLDGLRDVLALALRDATLAGSAQVTALLSLPELDALFRGLGFVINAVARFCWHPRTTPLTRALWTLADSDNDLPD